MEPTTSPPQPTTPPPQPTPAPVSPIPTPDDDKDDDDGGTAGPCLSHANTVHVLGKGRVSIADVQVGDLVLTAGASGKDEHYESVYALGHYDTKSKGQYIQFHFAGDSLPLEVTAEHLVFLKGNINPVRADSVKVGDIVQGTGLDANEFDFRVKKIRTLKRNGLYNPLTPSGTLIVNDGVVASTYISLSKSVDYFGGAMGVMSHQTYVHWMLAPFRLLCMGVSPSICNASLDEHGIPHYISFGMALHKLVQKQNSFVQMIFFGIVTMLCGICLLIETVFGASVGPITFLFLTITGVIVWKMAKNGYRGNTKLKTA